ncbi:hypothetical protein BGZ65_011594 [Modicella reniformis]|uniref:Dilute domain-containing protein n=1 Tax=Modicella reniformis TaxID=1440133 RepID=A0A9P6M2N0_9FUNG|nr:hypothetical protein BGZ65_011594 [Modicella reniformis]
MNPKDSMDMAAPSPYHHRYSQLSTSTMDDDDYSQSGLNSPASETSGCGVTDKNNTLYTQSGAKHCFSQSPDEKEKVDQDYFAGHNVDLQVKQMPVQSLTWTPSSSLKKISDRPISSSVEQLDINQLLDSLVSLDDPCTLLQRSISDEEKKSKMSKLLTRAASNGELSRITDILDNFRDWVDIDARDEDGSTALIHAACFGQTTAVSMLLDAGASVEERDSFGWTALVWATNSKREAIVRLLLNHGASPKTQTASGRTVVDFLRHEPNDTSQTAKIANIFKDPAVVRAFSSIHVSATLQDRDRVDRKMVMMTEDERQYQTTTMDDSKEFDADMTLDDRSLSDETDLEDEGDFDWEKCLPYQMLVFSSGDIPRLINTVITTMEPIHSKPYKPIPAYVLFLAARFARNFSTPDLLDELLDSTISAIHSVTKSKPDDVILSAFWTSNTSSLVHFLRKDATLYPVLEVYEEKFEILLRDILQIIVMDAEKRIEQVLEPAMLEHVTIGGLGEVKFKYDWAFSFWRGIGNRSRSFRRSKRFSAPPPMTPMTPIVPPTPASLRRPSLQTQRPPPPGTVGVPPTTITTTLSSLLCVMQMFDVHPEITQYVVARLLYYTACEVFNIMIQNRKYLSRSQALQTRLNLSVLEDWLRNNRLPSRLADQLTPLVQLLQLLQVLSQQKDLATWIETRKKVDMLNATQIKQVVNMYRYEVDEQRLPPEVTKYVLQVVADTEKVRRQSLERKASTSSFAGSVASSKSYACSVHSRDEVEVVETASVRSSSGTIRSSEIEQGEDETAVPSTTKNSRTWVLFQIPNNLAARDDGAEREFVPQIPDEVMSLLDSQVYGRTF